MATDMLLISRKKSKKSLGPQSLFLWCLSGLSLGLEPCAALTTPRTSASLRMLPKPKWWLETNAFDKYKTVHTRTITVWNPTRKAKKCKGKLKTNEEKSGKGEESDASCVWSSPAWGSHCKSPHVPLQWECWEEMKKGDVKGGKHSAGW